MSKISSLKSIVKFVKNGILNENLQCFENVLKNRSRLFINYYNFLNMNFSSRSKFRPSWFDEYSKVFEFSIISICEFLSKLYKF